MSVLRAISRRDNVAVLAPHHTSKGGSMSQNRAGNADIARGAGSIINSARVALTLVGATDRDREAYGIAEKDKHLYVRMDDAKMNLALANDRSVWFRKEGVKLYNGDDVGVLNVTDLKKATGQQRDFIGSLIAGALVLSNRSTMSVKEAAMVLRDEDELYAKMTEMALRQKIESALMRGVRTESGNISWQRDGMKSVIVLG